MPVTVRADLAQMPTMSPSEAARRRRAVEQRGVDAHPRLGTEAIADAASQVNRYRRWRRRPDGQDVEPTWASINKDSRSAAARSVCASSSCRPCAPTPGGRVPLALVRGYPIVTQIAGARGVKVPLTPRTRSTSTRSSTRSPTRPGAVHRQPEQPDRLGAAHGRADALPRPRAGPHPVVLDEAYASS